MSPLSFRERRELVAIRRLRRHHRDDAPLLWRTDSQPLHHERMSTWAARWYAIYNPRRSDRRLRAFPGAQSSEPGARPGVGSAR